MSKVFVLQNQHQQLLNKQGQWTDGREANSLYRTVHRDEALNHAFEAGSKDYTLRINLLECELSERGLPQVDSASLPSPSLVEAAENNNDAEPSSERVENTQEPQQV